MNTRGQHHNVEHMEVKPFGAYTKLEKPGWLHVAIVMSCVGTCASIFLYGRVLLPIADLVSGTNPLKSVRNESRHHGGHSSVSFVFVLASPG